LYTLAIDTETNAKDVRYDPDFRMLGLSYAYRADDRTLVSRYLPIGHFGTGNIHRDVCLHEVQTCVGNADKIVFHNAGFDLQVILRGLGLDLSKTNWYDTMIMQHFVDENFPNKSLDFMAKIHLGKEKVHDQQMADFINGLGWGFIPVWLMEPYAKQDAVLTLELFEFLYPEFVRQGFDARVH